MKRIVFFILFIAAFSSVSIAQMGKANTFYENYDFADAIPIYKKHSDRGNVQATLKLAECYRATHNYTMAEKYYAKAVTFKEADFAVHFKYVESLRNNRKYDLALKQLKVIEQSGGDKQQVKKMQEAVRLAKRWSMEQQIFTVKNMNELNTKGADFCAVPYSNGIVFESDKNKDLINGDRSSIDNHPYTAVYFAKSKDSVHFEKAELFSRAINSNFHNGTLSFTKDHKTVYFTRVENPKEKGKHVRRPHIYSEKFVGDAWSSLTPFFLNDDDYSVAHPSVNGDESILFFSSDMPGGQGGKDIWMCKREGTSWSAAINLGNEVNSSSDEVFPYNDVDGTLYFSSDGLPGIGGLDIFSTRFIDGKWTAVKNLQMPINSSTDDFGIYFLNSGKKGYFSSNRPGGLGDDDIYYFQTKAEGIKVTEIAGNIMKDELESAAAIKVTLIDESGELISETTTDDRGYFAFKKLNPALSYVVLMNAEDVIFKQGEQDSQMHGRIMYDGGAPGTNAKVVIRDKAGATIREILADDNGYFMYKMLGAEDSQLTNDLDEEDTELMTYLFEGTVVSGTNENNILSKVRVDLKSNRGDLLQSQITDDKGYFSFNNLSHKESYVLGLDENEAKLANETKVHVKNKKGTIVLTLEKNNQGKFLFMMLPQIEQSVVYMEIEDSELNTTFAGQMLNEEGNKEGIPYAKVFLFNNDNEVLSISRTDKDGRFSFKNLPSEGTYFANSDISDSVFLKYSKIAVVDRNGRRVMSAAKNAKGQFSFKLLENEVQQLLLFDLNDTEFAKKRVGIVGKLLAGENSDILAVGVDIILSDNNGKELSRFKTDNRGYFRISDLPVEQNYTLLINEKSEVIAKSKVHVLLGKIISNGDPNNPFVDVNVTLGSENGAVLKSTKTDKNGFFRFESQLSDYNKLEMVSEEETALNVGLKVGLLVENIYYDLAKFEVSTEAQAALTKIASILSRNPNVLIELSSHTDSRGSDEENLSLSQKRAKAAIDFIIQNGGDPNRIKAIGYGESRIINRCTNGVNCSEQEHQQNRRTELKVTTLTKK